MQTPKIPTFRPTNAAGHWTAAPRLPSSRDVWFPAKTLPQLVADGGKVLPALEIATDLHGAHVDVRRPLDIICDGTVERRRLILGAIDTRTQFCQCVDTVHIADVKPVFNPVESTHRRWSGTCQQWILLRESKRTYSCP